MISTALATLFMFHSNYFEMTTSIQHIKLAHTHTHTVIIHKIQNTTIAAAVLMNENIRIVKSFAVTKQQCEQKITIGKGTQQQQKNKRHNKKKQKRVK